MCIYDLRVSDRKDKLHGKRGSQSDAQGFQDLATQFESPFSFDRVLLMDKANFRRGNRRRGNLIRKG